MTVERSFEAITQHERDDAETYRPHLGQLDRELLEFVTTHAAGETEMLAAYQRAAADTADEHVRYLLELIIADERRHHQVLAEMANYFYAGLGVGEPGPSVPWLVGSKQPEELRAATDRFIAAERRDRRELKRYRRRLGPLRRTTLLGALVDGMICDTEKHLRLLRAIRRSARA